MRAEDELQKWYKACEPKESTPSMINSGLVYIQQAGILIAPRHIDLIANLVVERLKKEENNELD